MYFVSDKEVRGKVMSNKSLTVLGTQGRTAEYMKKTHQVLSLMLNS